jgi:DNA-3-methyladenine glycosylase II
LVFVLFSNALYFLMHYFNHLSKDKKLKPLIKEHGAKKLNKRKDICIRLCASIMSQQLSVKVAEVIYKRFLTLFEDGQPNSEKILALKPETLRSIGLSNAKVSYVQNVARFAVEKGMDRKALNKMSNEEVIEYLTEIKGVGRWTVEMLLMFTLGREDVFAVDDNGIQNAMHKLYRIDKKDKKKFKEKMILISEKWSPYRTYACLHLWAWKDNAMKV